MFDWIFKRRETLLTLSEIACLRAWLRISPLPPVPYAGGLPPTIEQALLLFSLSYAGGVRIGELSQMLVDALLNEDGSPGDFVRIRQETTKHRVSRRVPMHPDIRRDVAGFHARHPSESRVAFVKFKEVKPRCEAMSAHALQLWFRTVLGNVETDLAPGASEQCSRQRGIAHG